MIRINIKFIILLLLSLSLTLAKSIHYCSDIESCFNDKSNYNKIYEVTLTGKKLNEIPKAIFNFKNLKSLNLSNNNITVIPSEIGNLKNLKFIDFGNNSIVEIPKEICNLRNLKSLYLFKNKITSLSKEICDLKKNGLHLDVASLCEMPIINEDDNKDENEAISDSEEDIPNTDEDDQPTVDVDIDDEEKPNNEDDNKTGNEDNNKTGNEDNKSGKVKEIIDLSKYNTVSDYDAAAKAVDGVILRAGFRGYGGSGKLVKDEKLDTHYEGFVGKLKIGYYFFSQAITVEEAREEADTLLDYIADKATPPQLPLFIDSEYSNPDRDGRADDLSVETRTECLVAFVARIRERGYGYTPGVYASENWYRDQLDIDQIVASGASIWVANYSREPSIRTLSFDAWQYSSTATVEGIIGPVDRSHVYADW